MSLSASAENLTVETQDYDGSSNMCLELALEGERLCKAGDCRAGVAFFQAAIQAGTDDLRTLSAIYSQLGNAYFYLGDYGKAMQYHKHDLTLARTMGDKLGEAKSSGNLGNTLKVMGRFDEAVVCCKRHLELSRELGDRLSEGRALYNLGNVFHAKGKHIGRVGHKDPGDFSDDVKGCLQEAVSYYEENLTLMRELGDIAAQGRACGNLGNTFYLLGDFAQAIHYHEERLSIARQFGDKAAERRAHSNLGNSHIFMGQFEEAAHHYKRTLALAQELGDHAVEAQACYSLGNTYTLLRDYETAIEYHLRHLLIAQNLADRIGEGRACWSLGNANASLGNHEKALQFAKKHLEISKELGDPMGEATAKMNIADLRKILNLPDSPESCDSDSPKENDVTHQRIQRVRRESMEQLSLIKLTPDGKQRPGFTLPPMKSAPSPTKNEDDDSFFDLLSRFQSKRMDDQRCSLTVDNNKENTNVVNLPRNEGPDDLIDMIAGMQSKRMDEQRVALPHLPGLQSSSLQKLAESRNNSVPDDNFLDQLVRCQGSRLEDQRSPLPMPAVDVEADPPPARKSGATVPDEDFISLIMRFQSGRMDDQRAAVPRVEHRMANGNVPHATNGISNNFKSNSSGKKKK
ncbi:G-protein-signaling modulator 2 isoform X1 [Tribolium castaneum]|uniref:G-protein-signaling modulator 2-like Protein n=1 Tax=Tribolium castaneum TaxID=7070 RepID=D6WEG2_TRICA|nr:PREDICTED: G-protein-signaling modulator 2 isoform X1 [Tribolium castaneum]EFA00406.2 G-protein-signaling modulator 2-like Protein [Tribolium castaneum]|eukprot:XP_972826.1 PREDICTED: G-protein-signaling modulator 2 isoform X1 [Tribolium castaneum]